MKIPFVFVILLFAPTILFSQEKTFVREYLYSAGETDSKISARAKALEQVKVLLLEELGTYVESWVNYKVEEKEKINKDFFEQEIKTISAGITETKILDENWNGYEYFIKAEITADPEEVVRRINKTLSARRSSVVIDSLKLLLSSSKQEIGIQSKELEKAKAQLELQNKEVKSKQETLNYLNQQLIKAKQQLSKFQSQEKQILSEIESIERKISNATTKAVANVRIGMTPSEVKQVCGSPRSTADCAYTHLFYNYGNVWVYFESEIVVSVFYAKYFEGACCGNCGNYRKISIK